MKLQYIWPIFAYLLNVLWPVFGNVENGATAAAGSILCANSVGFIAHIAEDGGPEEISTESPFQECVNYCYTFWQEDPINGTITIMGQGCWDTSGKPNECDRTQCLADKKPPKAMNNTKFCCCSESMCNVNFTDAYIPGQDGSTQIAAELAPKNSSIILYIVAAISFLAIAVSIFIVAYYLWRMRPKKDDVEGGHDPVLPPPPPDFSLDKLKLLNVIGQGHYGCVWRGLIDDHEVAVKVFSPHHRHYFHNEHDMYKMCGENTGLLKCFGGGEHATALGCPADYLLLLSLEQECLQEYLREHTLDLATLAKMSLGVARGLAHLHSDLGKVCIVHRDVNTRNILVRADLSCCLCDLGLAVSPRHTENKALSEAGTLRYMAPEVLEGAVNLRDCESALKQIDVYALGLVLWEMGVRCTDLQNSEPLTYAPPFFKEVGESPSLEQMQTLVSRHKARPLWPVSWKDSAAARLLCETAEDCWDQDAEARLTSLCVVERLLELPTLKGRVLHSINHHPTATSPTPLINNNHLHDHQIDASVGTIETLLSPSEEHCKNSNQLAACTTPLQPYQGRNPCLERNLLNGSSDSLLIDKSSKHCCTSSESQTLITNDFLNFQINYRAMPIPYLQNAVHGQPKQHNSVPDNNHAIGGSRANKFKWNGFMKLFNRKGSRENAQSCSKETQVKLQTKLVNSSFGQNGVTTSLLQQSERPSSLPLRSVNKHDSTASGVSQLMKRKNSWAKQHRRSLEQFNQVFSSVSDLSRLKDPSQRVKTPGDVPPSVRRNRGKAAKESSARFSLYDDRMMTSWGHQWGSAPDLEPPPAQQALNQTDIVDVQDRDSISSIGI